MDDATPPSRILIIADDPLVRSGLVNALDSQPLLYIVGQVGSTVRLNDELGVYRPDVLLWDLGWSTTEAGLVSFNTVLIEIEDSEEDYPIVLLAGDEQAFVYVQNSLIYGILTRDSSPEQLSAALFAASNGLKVYSEELISDLLPGTYSSPILVEDLTPREKEVLQLLSEGMTNRAIARQLEVTEHTVKFHVNAIMSKLDAQSRTEAVVKATRLGLISL